jgi:hypothetical protein
MMATPGRDRDQREEDGEGDHRLGNEDGCHGEGQRRQGGGVSEPFELKPLLPRRSHQPDDDSGSADHKEQRLQTLLRLVRGGQRRCR